jgi:hypothetical protein
MTTQSAYQYCFLKLDCMKLQLKLEYSLFIVRNYIARSGWF